MSSRLRVGVAALVLLAACKNEGDHPPAPAPEAPPPPSIYELSLKHLDGSPAPLAEMKGKVALIVNVASECGYTPQYEGLQKLHQELSPRGFVILGFPSNDFGQQEPGSPEEIAKFAAGHYHITFPLFEKVKTSGPEASPIYQIAGKQFGPPKWNFHKYLVGKDGKLIQAFPSAVTPESDELGRAIDAALAK